MVQYLFLTAERLDDEMASSYREIEFSGNVEYVWTRFAMNINVICYYETLGESGTTNAVRYLEFFKLIGPEHRAIDSR